MRAARRKERGFALLLALFLMLSMAFLVAILLDGALQELRASRGDLAAARAQAAAGSALSDLLASRPDSALLALPRGSVMVSATIAGADTTRVSIQALGGGLVRCLASARIWSGGVLAEAATLAFARVGLDSAAAPGTLQFRRLPGWWWAELP